MANENEAILRGVRVAVLITDGFEQSEFDEPVWELKRAGARVEVLAQRKEQLTEGIRGMNHFEPAHIVQPDKLLTAASPEEYDGLLLPGGALNADALRVSSMHRSFVKNMMNAGKPIAVICHGGWLLADAGVLQGYTMTSWPAIQKDLERAGAVWKDAEVIEDRNLVSSRKPADVAAFSRAFIRQLSRVVPGKRAA